jgi:hypothetical protein
MPWQGGIMLTAERFVSANSEWRRTDERDNRDTLERYRQSFLERQNHDAIADLMHDDYVEEYPQIRREDSRQGQRANRP